MGSLSLNHAEMYISFFYLIQETKMFLILQLFSWHSNYFLWPVFYAFETRLYGLFGQEYYNAKLRVKYYLWYLSVFYGSAIIIARGAEKEEGGLAGGRRLVHHLLQSFCAIVGIWTLMRRKTFILISII